MTLASTRSLDVLFFMRHPGFIRNFESVLRELAARGHRVHVAFDRVDAISAPQAAAAAELRALPGITVEEEPLLDRSGWEVLARAIRRSLDYLRYFEPAYADAPRLRERAAAVAPAPVRWAMRGRLARRVWWRHALARCLSILERALPASPAARDLLDARRPDLVLVTPLVDLGSPQPGYVRAARARGRPCVLLVASWDNLTNKGGIREAPDLVVVWNQAQLREAVELHGVPPDRVVVSGAHTYDHWFEWRPATAREEFCRTAGLADDRPFVLYVCSSAFIAPDETRFVRRWLERLRADDVIGDTGILIRPHPQNAEQWATVDVSDWPGVTVWPVAGEDPVTRPARSAYYDSIFHSAAVMGINTSALVESAIVGRPVHTLLLPEFAASQVGTLHFHRLLNEGGGLLRVASSFDEHLGQLRESVAAEGRNADAASFVRAFIRPLGLEKPATPALVSVLEGAARTRSPAGSATLTVRALRIAMAPVALAAASVVNGLRRGRA